MSDTVGFSHLDKHENLLQIYTKIFDGYGQAFPKFPKKQVCNVFTISLKKLEGSQMINSKQYTDANILGI